MSKPETAIELSRRQVAVDMILAAYVRAREKHSPDMDDSQSLAQWVAYATRQLGHAVVYVKDLGPDFLPGDDFRHFRKAMRRVGALALAAIVSVNRRLGKLEHGDFQADAADVNARALGASVRAESDAVQDHVGMLTECTALVLGVFADGRVIVAKDRHGLSDRVITVQESINLILARTTGRGRDPEA